MEFLDDNDVEKRIFLDALVTYSDSCTLPALTPSCPFYVNGANGPTCGEQCREIAERHGVGDRTIKESTIGGLVMTGREIPYQSVAGVELFDARQKFIVEHQEALGSQSTTTLLIGLQSVLTRPFPYLFSNPCQQALRIWSEISSRRIPIESIVSGSLLRQFAYTVTSWAVVSNLAKEGLIQSNYGKESHSSEQAEWGELLARVHSDFDANAALSLAPEGLQGELPPRPADWLRTIAGDETAAEQILTSNLVRVAFSNHFLGRVEEWFYRLLEEDLEALLRASVAPLSVFQALPVVTNCRDQVGLWLWDRFTETNLEDWTTSSLLLEYRAGKGEEITNVPRRLLAERSVLLGDVAELLLERMSKTRTRQIQRRGLQASNFADSAAAQLRAGNFTVAENIFSGLIELRLTDGEAWNNLGFCQIVSDPNKALASLQRAAVFLRTTHVVNTANQILSLHLLRRDTEALVMGSEYMQAPDTTATSCLLWKHPNESGPMELQEVRDIDEYLHLLMSHIQAGHCHDKASAGPSSRSAEALTPPAG